MIWCHHNYVFVCVSPLGCISLKTRAVSISFASISSELSTVYLIALKEWERMCVKSLQSCPTVHKPMDYNGILQEEYWRGLPCPPSGHLPNPGMEPMSLMPPALADGFFTTSTTWEAQPWPLPTRYQLHTQAHTPKFWQTKLSPRGKIMPCPLKTTPLRTGHSGSGLSQARKSYPSPQLVVQGEQSPKLLPEDWDKHFLAGSRNKSPIASKFWGLWVKHLEPVYPFSFHEKCQAQNEPNTTWG